MLTIITWSTLMGVFLAIANNEELSDIHDIVEILSFCTTGVILYQLIYSSAF